MRHLALLSLAGLTLAAPGLAEPLDRSRVPASARWLIHFDMEAALRSRLVGKYLEDPEFRLELDEGLAELRQHTGLDPLKDLFGITLFGDVQSPDRGVMLLATSSAVEGALAMLPELTEGEVDVSFGLVDGFEVTSIGAPGDDDRLFIHPVRAADGLRTTLVVAKDHAQLGAAIRTVRGEGVSLASAIDPALAARPSADSILFAATADGLERLEGVRPASQIARLAQAIVFDLGESRDALVGNLALTSATAEDARNMASVLMGAVALANLAGADEPEARPFLDLLAELDFRTVDRTVSVAFAYDVDRLLQLVQELEGRSHGHHGDHHDGDEVIIRTEKKYEFEY